jgi:hypothetical protein
MKDDAGIREVFRGDLTEVEMAAGVLEEHGIEFQRRWEQAGGTAFTIGDTALVPGRTAVLLVPSIAYDEAREVLAGFSDPEPEYLSDLTSEVQQNRSRRRTFARVVAFLLLFPTALWLVVVLAVFLRELLRR